MHNTENDANVPKASDQQENDSDANAVDRTDDRAVAGREGSTIDETLHHALSDLEQILQQREGTSAAEQAGRPAGEALIEQDTDQYTIPLLDEVVRPGTEPQVSLPADDAKPVQDVLATANHHEHHDDSEPALRRRLAERLASEIEIITQDRIEAALEKAHEEIRAQVRNHLDIILPEVVEELSQARRRRGDDPDH